MLHRLPRPPGSQARRPPELWTLHRLRNSRGRGSCSLSRLRGEGTQYSAHPEGGPVRRRVCDPARGTARLLCHLPTAMWHGTASRCRPRSRDRSDSRPPMLPLQHQPCALWAVWEWVRGLPRKW